MSADSALAVGVSGPGLSTPALFHALIHGVPRRGFFRKKRDVRCTLCTLPKRREEVAVQSFLDGLVRSTKTVMTRVELGGTLFLVAVVGVLLTSRDEGDKSP